mmetsp:Transcript_875/g.2114  ORF Transcript_875/g.2114 Transcript_875/m.2114 type:complete len:335 (-) Transcript_875:2-1006(-)
MVDTDPCPNTLQAYYPDAAGTRLRVTATGPAGVAVSSVLQLGTARAVQLLLQAPSLIPPLQEAVLEVHGVDQVWWSCAQIGLLDLVTECPSALTSALTVTSTSVLIPSGALTEGRYLFTVTSTFASVHHRLVVRETPAVSWVRITPSKQRLRHNEELVAQAEIEGGVGDALWMLVELSEQEWTGEATYETTLICANQVRALRTSVPKQGLYSDRFPASILEEGTIFAPVLVIGNATAVSDLREELRKEGRRSRLPLRAPGAWFFPADHGTTVNAPPRGGLVTITPAIGEALSTPFHVATAGWRDERVEDLKFTFFVILSKGWEALRASGDELDE